MYTKVLNGRFIYISSELDYKERSVIAHELGHDQLHRFLMKKKGLGSFNFISNMSNRYEDEANHFAAELLISDASIVDMVCCEIPMVTSFGKKDAIAPNMQNIISKYSNAVPMPSSNVRNAVMILSSKLIGNSIIFVIHLIIFYSSLPNSYFVSPHTISMQTFTSI